MWMIPDESMIGEYMIEITAVDERGAETSEVIQMKIIDGGDPDISVNIISPEDGSVGSINDLWNFTGSVEGDIEISGGLFTLVWYIDETAYGTGEKILNISLTEGEHLVRLTLHFDGRKIDSHKITVHVVSDSNQDKPMGFVDIPDDGSTSKHPSPDENDRLLINVIVGFMVLILLIMFFILGLVVYRIRSDSTGRIGQLKMYRPRPSLPKGDIHFGPNPPALPPYMGNMKR